MVPQSFPLHCLKCSKIIAVRNTQLEIIDNPQPGREYLMIRCRNCRKENYIQIESKQMRR